MKKVIINVFAIAAISMGFAQTNGSNETVALTGVTVKPINLSYLNAVLDEDMPEDVKYLENKAARFDVTTSEIYDSNFEAYEVMFEQTNGSIMATYDQNGQIIESLERFKDITLPLNIREQLAIQHPGWTIHSDVYLVSYYRDKEMEKKCKIQLRKDGKKKNIKLDLASINQ